MGFADKLKTAVKDADTKLGNSIDKGKLDSQIRDEERNIEKAYTEIGKAVADAVADGKAMADIDVKELLDKIAESKKKIADFENQKAEIDAPKKEEAAEEEKKEE